MIGQRQNFRQEIERLWQSLHDLVVQAEGKPSSALNTEEWAELGALYRRAGAHLPRLKNDPVEASRAKALNALLVRAHALIYRPKSVSILSSIWEILRHKAPVTFRQNLPFIAMALVLILVGGIAGYVLVDADPNTYYAIVPMEEDRSPGATLSVLEESLLSGRGNSTSERSVFTSWLWIHNTQVALLALCAGVLAGIPAILSSLYNGLMLGAMSQVFVDAGLGLDWTAWLIAHGVTEFLALAIASGVGMRIGWAMIFPGDFSRQSSVRRTVSSLFPLIVLILPMLLLAAFLEGFFRQTDSGTWLRVGVGLSTALLWMLYFTMVGQPARVDLIRK